MACQSCLDKHIQISVLNRAREYVFSDKFNCFDKVCNRLYLDQYIESCRTEVLHYI